MQVLYITYDGILDPLGQSQILPYLRGLTKYGYSFHVVSFEKPNHNGGNLRNLLKNTENLRFYPLRYRRADGVSNVIFQILALIALLIVTCKLMARYQIKLIHCRSFVQAALGVVLKKIFGSRMLYDCRGFWIDERVEKNLWDLRKIIDRTAYLFCKWLEPFVFKNADSLVMLSEQGVTLLAKMFSRYPRPVFVVPCSVDFRTFKMFGEETRLKVRNDFGISPDSIVIAYLGSIGEIYLFREYIRLLDFLRKEGKNVFGLIITTQTEEARRIVSEDLDINPSVAIVSAQHSEIPILLSGVDVLASFIRPSQFRLASSPTKNAEALACGVPLIINSGVGDYEKLMKEHQFGICIKDFSDESYRFVLSCIEQLKELKSEGIRTASEKLLSLSVALRLYQDAYENATRRSQIKRN